MHGNAGLQSKLLVGVQIRELVESTPTLRALLDVHSYSQLILAPWLHKKDERPPYAGELGRRSALADGLV